MFRPQHPLPYLGARIITTRYERGTTRRDPQQRGRGILHAAQARGVSCRADDEELIVHHEQPTHEVA